MKIPALSFFSGIGGLERGLSRYIDVKSFCDIDPYCQGVLSQQYPDIPIHDDIRTFPKTQFSPETINMIIAGTPLTDKSSKNNRYNLMCELLDLVKYYKPRYVYLENMANCVSKGLGELVRKFQALHYDTRWVTVQASDTGALHRRNRLFLLAGHNDWLNNFNQTSQETPPPIIKKTSTSHLIWDTEPDIPRTITEVSTSDKSRIYCLGNAVIPRHALVAFHLLLQCDGTQISPLSSTPPSSPPQYPETVTSVLTTIWNSSIENYLSTIYCETRLPSTGAYSRGRFYKLSSEYHQNFIGLHRISKYPPTIQRFNPTDTLPSPTLTDHHIRPPKNIRGCCPGKNKSMSLNNYLDIFPTRQEPIPALNQEGYLDRPIVGKIPHPRWIEWLMGFPDNWTCLESVKNTH